MESAISVKTTVHPLLVTKQCVVQEMIDKARQLPGDIQWHFIGTLQGNKCKMLAQIPNLYMVETIDSAKKAAILNKACADRETPLFVMLQINTSGEETKGGISPNDCVDTAKAIVNDCPRLSLKGVMTIGSVNSSGISPNPDFELLKRCKESIENSLQVYGLELSMGMSHDFETAISQGSTNVRVGSLIFGSREAKS